MSHDLDEIVNDLLGEIDRVKRKGGSYINRHEHKLEDFKKIVTKPLSPRNLRSR